MREENVDSTLRLKISNYLQYLYKVCSTFVMKKIILNLKGIEWSSEKSWERYHLEALFTT